MVVQCIRMKLARTPFVVLALVLLIQVSAVASPRNPAPRKADIRGTAQQPLIIKAVANTEKLRQDAEYRADQAADASARTQTEHAQEWNNQITDGIGIATVLILIVQAIAFFLQTRQMKESVDQMKQATSVAKHAADMAKTSADAANDANGLNRDALSLNREAFVSDQRPWIHVIGPPKLAFTLEIHRWHGTVEIEIMNKGKSPAQNVRLAAQLINGGTQQQIETAHLNFCQSTSQQMFGILPRLPQTGEARDGLFRSVSESWFPEETRNIEGRVAIPKVFDSDLPLTLLLSACVFYEMRRPVLWGATAFLYKLDVVDREIVPRIWRARNPSRIPASHFSATRLPYGWMAD